MDERCCICLEDIFYVHQIHVTQCQHKFHLSCFTQLQHQRCPLCQTPFTNDIIRMNEEKRKIKDEEDNLYNAFVSCRYHAEFEVFRVISFLKYIGIPSCYIPVYVRIQLDDVAYDEKIVFFSLLSHVVKYLCDVLELFCDDDDNPDDIYDVSFPCFDNIKRTVEIVQQHQYVVPYTLDDIPAFE